MEPTWHFIEGEAGCAFAVAHNAIAIVVDALRASATAAMLLDAGATEIIAVRTVDEALALKDVYPDALLFGERHAVPPPGFDFGNSPQDASHGRGRRCIFTTTTGAGRLVACWGAGCVLMGSPINARSVGAAAHAEATKRKCDVVVIPAGLASNPHFDAQEDWAGAAAIAMAVSPGATGKGTDGYLAWAARIRDRGLPALFHAAPHAANLVRVGMGTDIAYCAQLDVTTVVPYAVAPCGPGLRVVRFEVGGT